MNKKLQERRRIKMKKIIMIFVVALVFLALETNAVYADGAISPSPDLTEADINIPRSNWLMASSSPNEGAQAELEGDIIHITPPGGNFIYFISGGWTYNNPDSPQTEVRDLSHIGSLVVGLRGYIYSNNGPNVFMTIRDINGAVSNVFLLSVNSSVEQYWPVPTTFFSGVDLTQIETVSFSVAGYNISTTRYDIHFRGPKRKSPVGLLPYRPIGTIG